MAEESAAVNQAGVAIFARPCRLDFVHVYNPSTTDAAELYVFDADAVAGITVGTTAHSKRLAIGPGFCGPLPIGKEFASGVTCFGVAYGLTTAPASALHVSLGFPAQ